MTEKYKISARKYYFKATVFWIKQLSLQQPEHTCISDQGTVSSEIIAPGNTFAKYYMNNGNMQMKTLLFPIQFFFFGTPVPFYFYHMTLYFQGTGESERK